MATDAIGSSAQGTGNVTYADSTKSTAERMKQKTLGQDEFFKLLTTQLASQDPLKPMEDTAFIAQMAAFSELEMTSNLTKSFEKFTSIQQLSAAQGFLGKTVTLSNGEAPGKVTAIEHNEGETMIFLNGNSTGYSVDQIKKVED